MDTSIHRGEENFEEDNNAEKKNQVNIFIP